MTITSRVTRVTAAGAVALAVALVSTTASVGAPLTATLTADTTDTLTVAYGSDWRLTYLSTEPLSGDSLVVQATGIPGAADSLTGFAYSQNFFTHLVTVYPKPDGRLINVGLYSVGVNATSVISGSEVVRATTLVPHSLVIEPAELAARILVSPSSADTQHSVVSMTLGGDWLSGVAWDYRTAEGRAILDKVPAPPAGIWTMTITDAAGDTIVEREFEQVRGAEPATVYLWMDAPLAAAVTVDATFTATGDEARNFSITQAEPVTFTTGSASRPGISLPVVPEDPSATVRSGVGVPLWALLLIALLGIGAGVTGAVVGLRPGRVDETVDPEEPLDGTPDIDSVGSPGDGDVVENIDTSGDRGESWSLASAGDIDETELTTETEK